MYEDLVKRLRSECALPYSALKDMRESADAIEELICEVADEHNRRVDAEERQRWIPVTEQLPELNTSCLLYNKYYGPMVGTRIDDMRFRIPGSRFPDTPTHWMPLPEPPKEET